MYEEKILEDTIEMFACFHQVTIFEYIELLGVDEGCSYE